VPEDSPTGAVNEAVRRNPRSVVASAFESAQPEQSAVATAAESEAETAAVRTPAELLAGAAELATAGRTERWLDELVDAGHLTANDRDRIAAEDGGPTLSRLLRRAELAGHDPHQVLTDAVTAGPLAGSRQLTSVLHHRITENVTLDPRGDSYRDWTPKVGDPQWQVYLDTLADAADDRTRELGEEVLAEPPQWAIEAFGPAPETGTEQAAWVRKAGIVAAHRELTGQEDPTLAIGEAPKSGQVETYASWRAAWRALGRPEAARDELEMSDGQLRLRIRAYEREEAWEPRYVGNELAGTTQAASKQRHEAELRDAAAAVEADPAQRERFEQEAAQARALAHVLDQRATELSEADRVRGLWYAHTAETRAAADRARAELAVRDVDSNTVDEPTSAEEWLAENAAADRAEDRHREIRADYEFAPEDEPVPSAAGAAARSTGAEDAATERAADSRKQSCYGDTDHHELESERRPAQSSEAGSFDEDIVRVPTADETAVTIARAQRALSEIRRREHLDRQREQDDRVEQLARWHADDTDRAEAASREERDSDALEYGGAS
jgi:hypothetical protein